MNKNIGDMTESELKDFIVELQEENSRYERMNQKYKEVIEKAIEYMKNNATSNYFDKEKNMFRREEGLLDILKEVE